MVALEHRGEVVVGAIALPVAGEAFWAWQGGGCWRDGERCTVSGVATLGEATLALGYLRALLAPPQRAAVLALVAAADRVRCPGDLAGPALLLSGRAEAWLEAGVHEWDLAPAHILVKEAGGRFTDFIGQPSHHMGRALATNGHVHDEILRILRRR
jgi:histidinol-phosphatase